MKKLIFIILPLLIAMNVYSQTSNGSNSIIGKSFVTNAEITVVRYDAIAKRQLTTSSFLLAKDTRFFINEVTDSGYIISIWSFLDTKNQEKARFYTKLNKNGIPSSVDSASKIARYTIKKTDLGISQFRESANGFEQLAYIDSWANQMQFFIPLKEFTEKCESIYAKSNNFTWGFLTLPIKARFANSDTTFSFEERVNFGLSFGWKWQHVGKSYMASNVLLGISVANVKLDQTNSQSALSLSGGYMFQYDKFQIGLFTGLDFIDQSSIKWKYQGKPWVGFAIGVSLFGEGRTTSNESQTQ